MSSTQQNESEPLKTSEDVLSKPLSLHKKIAITRRKNNNGRWMKKITKKQKIFADTYLQTGNLDKSARAGYNIGRDKKNMSPMALKNSAQTIAQENLKKPEIIEYIKGIAQPAMERIEDIAKYSKSDNVRYLANKDIVDRAIGRPASVYDLQSKGESLNIPSVYIFQKLVRSEEEENAPNTEC